MDRGYHCACAAVLKKFFKKMYADKTENVYQSSLLSIQGE